MGWGGEGGGEVCVEKEKKIFQKPSEESENEEMFNSIKY